MASFVPTAALTAMQVSMEGSQAKAQDKAMRANADAQSAQLRYAQQVDEADRRERLRRAIATQRARFGAQGLSSSGSATAVLSGLAAEADREATASANLTSLRLNALDQQVDGRRSLLEASSPRNRLAFTLLQRGLRSSSLIES